MKKILQENRRSGVRVINARDPVRLTALIYLREALLAEQYETCAEIIDIALDSGSNSREIFDVLSNPLRFPTS